MNQSVVDQSPWSCPCYTFVHLALPTQRYLHYISDIPNEVVAPQPPEQMMKIMQLLPASIDKSSKEVQNLMMKLQEDIQRDYAFSLKKSIGTRRHVNQ